MSWQISVMDLPADAKSVADIPNDFVPKDLGQRAIIMAKIEELIPDADFSDPSWGFIRGDGWSIEVNIGNEDICQSFAFHVRGQDEAVGTVAAILDHLKLRAVDCQTGEFFAAGPEALNSFRKWREFRDRVIGDSGA